MGEQDTGAELAADLDAAYPWRNRERPPGVTCSGGFTLPRISAFMPQLGDLLARKGQEDG